MVCEVVALSPPFQLTPSAYLPSPVVNKLRPCCVHRLLPIGAKTGIAGKSSSPPSSNDNDSAYGSVISSPISGHTSGVVVNAQPDATDGDYYRARKISFSGDGVAYLESGKRYLFIETLKCGYSKYFAQDDDFAMLERYTFSQIANTSAYVATSCSASPRYAIDHGLYELTYVDPAEQQSFSVYRDNELIIFLDKRRRYQSRVKCECQVARMKEVVMQELKAKSIVASLKKGLGSEYSTMKKASLVRGTVLKLARLDSRLRSDRYTGGIFGINLYNMSLFRPLDLLKEIVSDSGISQFTIPRLLPFTGLLDESEDDLAGLFNEATEDMEHS